jgi:hypothetical protein
MKYAIIGPRGAINRISDTEPQNVAEGATVVEITDEQAATVEAGRASEPKVFYFYKEGELLTAQEHREQQIAARPKPPKPSVSAEKHIEREGFPAIRLVTLMDLEGKLAQAGKTSAKLTAVRAWLDGILAAFAANPEPRNDWPGTPFGFEETVGEAMANLIN